METLGILHCRSWVEHRWSGWKYLGMTGQRWKLGITVGSPHKFSHLPVPCNTLSSLTSCALLRVLVYCSFGAAHLSHSECVHWKARLLAAIPVCATRRPSGLETEAEPGWDSEPVGPEHPLSSVPDAMKRHVNSMLLPLGMCNRLLWGLIPFCSHCAPCDSSIPQKANL